MAPVQLKLARVAPLKRTANPGFFDKPEKRARRSSERIDYALLADQSSRASQKVTASTPFSPSSPSSPGSEIGDSIIVESPPPGHDDYKDAEEINMDDMPEPEEFSGLLLEDRKAVIQTWFASRKKVEVSRRNRSSHVSSLILYLSTPAYANSL
jgi:hypothetical protein